jgi:beta-N-acetylhexosaminidase
MKRFFLLALSFALLLTLCACGQTAPASSAAADSGSSAGAGSSAAVSAEESPAPSQAELSSACVAELLAGMTPEEKVGQLFFVRVPEDDAAEDIKTYHLGGYLLFGRDTKDKTADDLIQTICTYQSAADADTGIPLLIGVDEEGGSVVRVSSNPHLRSEKYHSPRWLYAQGGMEAVLSEVKQRDTLLKALGFNVNLAPVCDISSDPADFMYDRSIGLSAEDTASYAAQTAAQMATDGMGSVLKHFPGYGDNADTHTGIAVDDRPYEDFVQSDFLPFSAGVDGGNQENGQSAAVLVSHNIVTCMDAELPASLSPNVHKLLREQLNFDGVVMTDDLAMDAVKAYAEDGNVAAMAINAGNDLVITTDYRTQVPLVITAVQNGTVSEETLNAAVTRVLLWKIALGLL